MERHRVTNPSIVPAPARRPTAGPGRQVLQGMLMLVLCAALPAAPVGKGDVYTELGRLSQQKAWRALETAAAAGLREHQDEVGFMRYHLWALREQGKDDAAITAAREYVRRRPREATLRAQLASALGSGGRAALKDEPGRAALLLAEALSYDDTRPHIHNLYGRALLASGQTGPAMEHLEKAAQRFESDEGLRFRLSQAYGAEWKRLKAKRPADGPTLAALAERIARQVEAGRPIRESRWFFRIAAGIFVELRAAHRMTVFFESLKKERPDDSYLFHLTAAYQRRLFDRDPQRFKGHYARAVNDRKIAFFLYERAHPDRPAVSGLLLPLRGTVAVINAVETAYTHYGYNRYCYDFLAADEAGNVKRAGTSGALVTDYIGFGAVLRATASGKVVGVDNHFVDLPIGKQVPDDNNAVRIEHNDGTVSVYLHNKQHSARVREGVGVTAGAPIAETGNSGWTVSPHTHFCVYDRNRVTLPIRFRGVLVQRPGSPAWTPHPGPYEKGWLLRSVE